MTSTGLIILAAGFILVTLASIAPIRQQVRGMFYGWKLVGIVFLVMTLVSGPVWTGVGVWVKALELQFGWSRTQLTGAFSLTQLEGTIIGPFVGYLIDRLGPRRMVLIGLTTTGVGFFIFGRTTNLAMFYLSYTLIMAGSMAGSWLPLMTALNQWFNRRRGTAMAIGSEGEFLGGFLLVPALAWSVTPGHLGWSATALWIGVTFVVVAWPISRYIRGRPEDYGELADGGPLLSLPTEAADTTVARPRANLEQDQPDFTARQAIRTRAFWFICFGHSLSSMLFVTMSVHMVPLLTDQGFSLQSAAYIWSVVMVGGAVFLLVGGYVGDRIPVHLALSGFVTMQTVGFFLSAFAQDLPMAFLGAVILGAGFGGRMPLTASIRGLYFGKSAYATISGISMAPQSVFMLGAPLFAATMFDNLGNYTLAFLILGVLGSTSGLFFLMAKKPELVDPLRESDPLPRPA